MTARCSSPSRIRAPDIAEENLDRIFDPFFTTKEAGTGLGLSVAHQVITQHGGRIQAERNPDRGMTFSISLRCTPGARLEKEPPFGCG